MAVMGNQSVATKGTASALLLSWMVVFTVFDDASAAVTRIKCQADYQALVSEIEANREKALKDIRTSIANTSDKRTRSILQHELERVWEEEETQRNQASVVQLDCLRAAKAATKSAN